MRVFIAVVLGFAAFLACVFVVWLYLATRTAQSGGSGPPLQANRALVVILPLAVGSAVACGGTCWFNLRLRTPARDSIVTMAMLMVVAPVAVSFGLLCAAQALVPGMRPAGAPVLDWSYLIVCGLPVVVGVAAAYKFEDWFWPPPPGVRSSRNPCAPPPGAAPK
jgi:hypothetical protein